jgi:opacity protein-like surface antigen
MVFGAELAYTSFNTPYVGFPNSLQENALELRARAGYAFDRVMVYGFVGAARSTLTDVGVEVRQTGVSYGLGMQALVTQSMFVGVELARRDVSGDALGFTVGSDIDTVSLRAGFQF